MRLLDKLYLNIYWCGNKGKGGGLIDEYLDRMFMIILFGVWMIVTSLICSIIKLDIKISGFLIVSGLISFFTSERIFKVYFTDDKKKEILTSYPKPNRMRYLILILISFGSLAFMIFGSILSGIIYHRLTIG
jgi:hypothetical protein